MAFRGLGVREAEQSGNRLLVYPEESGYLGVVLTGTAQPQRGRVDGRKRRSGILVRRFTEQPDWLRFGLPAGESEWKRLAAALASAPGAR